MNHDYWIKNVNQVGFDNHTFWSEPEVEDKEKKTMRASGKSPHKLVPLKLGAWSVELRRGSELGGNFIVPID